MGKRFYVDLAERVAWTAVQGFAAEWIVTSTLDAATFKVSAVAAAVAVAKCLLASRIGEPGSASTAPAS